MGDQAQLGNINEFGRAFAHAVVGCAAGAAGASAGGSNIGTGSGCGAGALGAVVGELAAQLYGGANPTKTIAFASALSGIAAALAGQGAEGVSIAAATGANAAENNYLSHANAEQLKKLKQKQQNGQCDSTCQNSIAGLELLDKFSNRALLNACVNGTAAECQAQVNLDPAALQYAVDNFGTIVGGRIIGQAGNNGGKALGSLATALEKLSIKPLVDLKGNIQGFAVDVGGADPATLRGLFGAQIYVGSEIILPTNALEFLPLAGLGLKSVVKGGEHLVVREATGEVVGKVENVAVNNAQQAATNGPLKNASGNLENAANSARNQPVGNGASASPAVGTEVAALGSNKAAGFGFEQFNFDVKTTFKNGQYREITLNPGTELDRAFQQGVNSPKSPFVTQGTTAGKLTSTEESRRVLAIEGTSDVFPDTVTKLRVEKPTRALIGPIKDGDGFQIIIDPRDLSKVIEIPNARRALQPR